MLRPAIAIACVLAALASAPQAGAGLVQSNQPYDASHPNLIFDWYAPDSATSGPTPLAIYLHGGQAGTGSKADVNAGGMGVIKDHLLRNGFTVMAVNFHPFPEFIYPVQLVDAALAVKFFKHNAAAFNIDPARVVLWGLSGGAIIGGLLSYGADFALPGGTLQEQQSTRPLAFLNVNGVSNFNLLVSWYPGVMFGKDFLLQVDPALLDLASFSESVIAIPRPYTPPAASMYGTSENPPPLVDPHDVTMMKDFHAHLATFPAAAAESVQLQTFPGTVTSVLEYSAEWTMHRALVHRALDLGNAKPAASGASPRLEIDGTFDPGSPYAATFEAADPAPATLYVFVGSQNASTPLLGGTLVPAAASVLVLATDPQGALVLGGTLPPTTPLGAVAYLQFLHAAPGVPFGVAFSNAVRVTVGI